MRNYYTNQAKPISVTAQICLSVAVTLLLVLSSVTRTSAQCSGGMCNSTITSNGNFSIPAGQTYCLNRSSYSGTITFGAGSTLCIGPVTNWNSATFTFSGASGTINNYGAANKSFTLPSGYTFNNLGVYTGTLTQQAGSVASNSTTFGGILLQTTGGTFSNFSGAIMSNTVTIKGTLTNLGTMTGNIGFATGGVLTNNSLITGATTVPTGATFNNNGDFSGPFAQTGGIVNNDNGGSFSPTTATLTAGIFNNMAGDTVAFGNITVRNGYTLNNYGVFTSTGLTVQSGGFANFLGTSQNINGSVSNQSTITMAGTLTITGSYTDATLSGATIRAVGSGTSCNFLQMGSVSNGLNIGTFDGNNVGLTLTGAIPSVTPRMVNGASGTVIAPAAQATGLSLSVAALTVSGSFTSPAATNGHIVLRYIGTTTPTDVPVSNTLYSVGDVIGSSTVEAITTGGAGTKSFSDALPISSCGQNVYYRVFSFNGTQPCEVFNLSSPPSGGGSMPIPTAAISAGGSTTFCAGGSVSLTAAGGGTYVWSTGATTAAITASANATYTVTVTNAAGCTASDNEIVTVNSASMIDAYSNINGNGWGVNASPSLCVGQSLTFGPQPVAGTWSYTGPAGFTASVREVTIPNMTVSQSGTYIATYTDGNGCSRTQNYNVTVNALPTPTVNSPSMCAGSSATLTATGGVSYVWSNGATGSSISVSPASLTTYTVTATNAAGCTATASGTVTVNAIPTATITAGGPTTFCAGGSVALTAGGGISYLWSTTATSTSISATTSAVYSVTATNAAGCTAAANRSVTVNAKPTPTSTNAASCSGASATITVSGGVSYVWSTGATTASLTPSPVPTATTTYTVTATNAAGCTATTSGTITVSNPVASTTNPAVCEGATATMTASGGVSYVWSTGSTTDTIRSLTAGVYSVTATNALGCTATASGIITVNSLPVVSVTSATFCAGSSATITASGGAIYTWSSGETTASITKNVAGTYSVTATNMGSCTATGSGTISAAANPTASATNGVTCSGVPAVITAAGGTSYAWSTTPVQTTASISVTVVGTYVVTVTNAAGCTATASSSVTAAALPTATVNSPGICVGASTTLTAGGGTSYTWSTGAITTSISVTPPSSTTYTVTVRNAAGCSAVATSNVTVNALPVASATGGVVCVGTPTSPAILTASGGTSYSWNTTPVQNTASASVTVAGTYTVTVTNAAGCTATTTAAATTAVKPTTSITNGNACNGTAITLSATGGTAYAWSNGGSTASISVTPATNGANTYNVTVTNAAGCFVTANATATVWALPTVSPASNTPVILGATINLTSSAAAGTPGYTYNWSGPSLSSTAANPSVASATPANGGIYYVTVTDTRSCTATGNTTVILNYAAPGGLGSNTALWLASNVGVNVTGTSVNSWADQSQLNNHASIVNGTKPTLVNSAINNYPTLSFGGAGGLQGGFSPIVMSSAVTAFIVTKVSTASVNSSGIFSIDTTGSIDSVSVKSAVLFNRGTGTLNTIRANAAQGGYTNASAIGQYHMATSMFNTAKDSFFVEGRAATTGTYSSTNFNSNKYSIGSRLAATTAGKFMTGEIAEVALFNRQVTNTERSQVESYLAIKYGFTLDQTTPQNYLASNGTIYWNAATNSLYKNNIFGVGKENVTALDQNQSVSINTNVLSINGAVGLTPYSYFVVSDSGGANAVALAANMPVNINARLTNKWRVSQTGARISANFVFNTSATNFGFFSSVSSSLVPYLLIDSDANGIFETAVTASSIAGSVSTFNANMRNGALFTCGFKADFDFGDANVPYTTLAQGGAMHLIVPGVYLGSQIDAEMDAKLSVNAMSDDTIGVADEDGVNFNSGVPTTVNIVTMGSNSIIVTASTAGYLDAWADFNQNGQFEMTSEFCIKNIPLVAGANVVTFNVSDSVEYGKTFMRFRFATGINDITTPVGLATNGEVEDYSIYVTAPLVGGCTNGFQNPDFEQGPAPSDYVITDHTNLPYWRTTAPDDKIEMWRSGFNGVNAYSGTFFMELEANVLGALYQDVYTTPGATVLWSFAHRGRGGVDSCNLKIGAPGSTVTIKAVGDGTSAWGVYNGTYVVPAGQYITRFEFNALYSASGDLSVGNFLDKVSVSSSFDYGDAPNSYGTLAANSGPYHALSSTLYLGTGESCDLDGSPSAAANIDLLDDGITFPAVCANCSTVTVNVSAYNNTGRTAKLAGWIDFNKNGVFETSERRAINVATSASLQSLTMTFNVTTFSAISATTYARFRIASDSTEIATPNGLARDGEVEDYKVPCVAMPTPVPSGTPSPVCARGPMTLNATGSAPSYAWTGPNGYTASTQNPTKPSVAPSDSGTYRVYAIYANGCATDSAIKITVYDCFVNIAGSLLDDANGNGVQNGTEITSNRGKTVYAVLADTTNKVLATSLAAANGAFSFTNVPAYTLGLRIRPSVTNPAVGATAPAAVWPTNWVGTKSQYGTNNLAGTGLYGSPNVMPVSVDIKNVSGILIGYDQLPSDSSKTYVISRPHVNVAKAIIPANGLGMFKGSDPEDGNFTAGSNFTIASLAGLNGNSLFYDANGDGILQAYEQITGYTLITNVDPTKFFIKFTGNASTSTSFTYGSTDAAGMVNPTPATYMITWTGALPVKMISFNANAYNETQAKLDWATSSEINNDHFEVQRSTDGHNWSVIGEAKGAGTTNQRIDYSFVDENPATGANYYRLKQIDFDGKFEYSEMAQVDFGTDQPVAASLMSMYPNPISAGKGLNITLKGSDDTIKHIVIVSEVGQVVYDNDAQDAHYEIQGLDLPAGIYMVNILSQANASFTGKVIVTR